MTLRKLFAVGGLEAYGSMNVFQTFEEDLSPTTPRSMLNTAAPFAAVRAQNSGE